MKATRAQPRATTGDAADGFAPTPKACEPKAAASGMAITPSATASLATADFAGQRAAPIHRCRRRPAVSRSAGATMQAGCLPGRWHPPTRAQETAWRQAWQPPLATCVSRVGLQEAASLNRFCSRLRKPPEPAVSIGKRRNRRIEVRLTKVGPQGIAHP